MKNLFQPLLLLITGATQKELSRQVATSRLESSVPQCPPQTGFPISDPSPKEFNWRLVIPTFSGTSPSARASKGFLRIACAVFVSHPGEQKMDHLQGLILRALGHTPVRGQVG